MAADAHSCPDCQIHGHRHYTLPPGHGATLSIGTTFITGHLADAVREASYRDEMIEYLSRIAKWINKATYKLIDSSSRRKAHVKVQRDSRLTIFLNWSSIFLQHNLVYTLSTLRHPPYAHGVIRAQKHLTMFFAVSMPAPRCPLTGKTPKSPFRPKEHVPPC
jgi:hypothetical protein